MSYTKEQCVERASEQPRPGYNLMSENEARELLRAHADALDEIESLKAKLKEAEEALESIGEHRGEGPMTTPWGAIVVIIGAQARNTLAKIREDK